MPPKSKAKTEVIASGRIGEGKPRLIIKKMVMENFKSYAGIQEIGPFHKCFSSIVGPNGSGKSNVIDSLLFVFGRRANQIRLKKISELIHNSSGKQLNDCRVSVHFCEIIDHIDNDEGYDIVPNSDIVISRTADKDCNSKYYINDKISNFTDVTNLLRTKGVDLDNNRFLILQGEVEQIAMMKPKAQGPHQEGLLEYLEDLIGSNKYVEAIEESFSHVERLTELRNEKLNRVKMVEKEKEGLEGAKSEAEEYLLKETELMSNSASLNQLFMMESSNVAKDAEAKKIELNAQLLHERNKLSETTKKLSAKEGEFSAFKKQFDDIGSELARTKADFSAFERKDIKIREDIKHESSQKKKQAAKAKAALEEKAALKTKLSELEVKVPEMEARVLSVSEEKVEADAKLDAIFESLKGKTEPLRLELEQKQKDLIPLRKVVNTHQQDVSVCEDELKRFEERSAKASTSYKDAKAKLASHEGETKALNEQLEAAESQVREQESRLVEVKSELDALEPQERALDDERRQTRNKLAQYRESASSSQSKSTLLQALMREKHRFTGLHGRLGDLGSIDNKYDVAITTACPALNNLVVDDTLTAEKCIEFLRQNKLGRATFTILEKLSARAPGGGTPENVARLIDLVKPRKELFRPAFASALGNTVVAENMDQAVRVAYGTPRWRVVTLEGELIDTSGAMSGGGKSAKRGGMSGKVEEDSAFSQKEAQGFERVLQDNESARLRLSQRRKSLEDEHKSLTAEVAKAKLTAKKCTLGLDSLIKQKVCLEVRVKDLEAGLKSSAADEKRIAELKMELAGHSKELAAAKKGAESLEAAISALQKKMLEAGGAALKTQKVRVESLSEALDVLSKDITKGSVELAAGASRIQKLEKEVASAEKEIEKSDGRLASLKLECKKMEEDAVAVLQAFQAAQAEQEAKGKQLETIQKEYEEFKRVVDGVRSVEVDINNKLDDFDRIIKDNIAKASHWQKKLEDLEVRIADNQRLLESEEKTGETVPSTPRYSRLTADQVAGLVKDGLQYAITMLEEGLKLMKPNMKAIAEYRKKEQEYLSRVEQLDQTTAERDTARKCYDGLRKKRLDEFMAGFSVISMKLKEMYQMLTLGGDAELELVDSLDPFSEGIVFSVRPPKKSWKNIQNLSGGEKTLSSLALVFALHHFKPTPLYVMDEIDAALDYKNVSIVANYIKERTKDAQFIIISLRNNMFELADRLVGIYKTDNATKSISIDPRKFSMAQEPEAPRVPSLLG